MNTTLIKFLQKYKDLMFHSFFIFYNHINFLNLNIVIFLGFILYKFYFGSGINGGLLALFVSFLISALFSSYVLNKFEYSKNIIVRILQKFVIYILILIFVLYLYFYIFGITVAECSSGGSIECLEYELSKNDSNGKTNGGKEIINVNSEISTKNNTENYNFQINKDLMDKGLQSVSEMSKAVVQQIAPNIGAGAAAGTATAAMVKATTGLPAFQRMGLIGGTAVITAASTKVGLNIGKAISKESDIMDSIKNSEFCDSNIERIPSPDNIFINSVLEKNEQINIENSPLEVLLTSLFTLNVLTLLLIIILLILIFNRYILHFNLDLILSLIEKYMPNKLKELIKKKVNKGIDYNNKFILIMFIVNSIILIIILLMSIFVSAELAYNINDYVTVYNHIHS
jgi:hypothetical protein